ncbi:MAG: hypothetical protein J4G16_14565 [Acidobacteria bacterium]|nr:hypothetical protein [Acidobacteriota bacterium]
MFPNLKPSTSRVTLRMPSWLLAELKREANRRDVPVSVAAEDGFGGLASAAVHRLSNSFRATRYSGIGSQASRSPRYEPSHNSSPMRIAVVDETNPFIAGCTNTRSSSRVSGSMAATLVVSSVGSRGRVIELPSLSVWPAA